MVPATDDHELALLTLGVLWPSQLEVHDGRERGKPLLNCDVGLILVTLMLSTDSQDERVTLFRAVKDQTVIEVYQAAAKSEFGGQEFDVDQSVCWDMRIPTKYLIQRFYL